MEAVDIKTGEILSDRDIEQERLFGGFESVEAYELNIVGATGFPGDENLTLGDEVTLTIRGRVMKVTQEVRIDKKTEDESLVRLAVVKATSVRVRQ